MVTMPRVSLSKLMVPTGKSGKVREKSENQEKLGSFTFQSQGKLRESGKVWEFISTGVKMLTRCRNVFSTVVRRLCTIVQNFSCLLRSQIICTLHF